MAASRPRAFPELRAGRFVPEDNPVGFVTNGVHVAERSATNLEWYFFRPRAWDGEWRRAAAATRISGSSRLEPRCRRALLGDVRMNQIPRMRRSCASGWQPRVRAARLESRTAAAPVTTGPSSDPPLSRPCPSDSLGLRGSGASPPTRARRTLPAARRRAAASLGGIHNPDRPRGAAVRGTRQGSHPADEPGKYVLRRDSASLMMSQRSGGTHHLSLKTTTCKLASAWSFGRRRVAQQTRSRTLDGERQPPPIQMPRPSTAAST